MLQLFAYAVIVLVLLYCCVLVVLWHMQERIVFQPPRRVPPGQVAARQVHYEARDGTSLFAYVVGDCETARTAMLAFHGNADLARWLVPWATRIAEDLDCCVMLPEYRGYDGLLGAPTYVASSLDARAALEYLRTVEHVPPDRTVYFGHSLGTAVAAELAAVDQPRSLILQSPFSTARAMGRRMFLPGLIAFWRLVSRVHFDTVARVQQLDCPVWVAHGDADRVVPVHMGREVFAAAKRKGELLIVPGGGHSDLAEVGGREYWDWLGAAVRAAAVPSTRDRRAETPRGP